MASPWNLQNIIKYMREKQAGQDREQYGMTRKEFQTGTGPWRDQPPGYLEALRTGLGMGAQREEAFTMGFLDPIHKRTYSDLYGETGQGGGMEDVYMSQITDPEAFRQAGEVAARSAASEIYKPGGQMQKFNEGVMGNAIQRGFAPQGGFAQQQMAGAHRAAGESIGRASYAASSGLQERMLDRYAQRMSSKEAQMMDTIESMGAMLQTMEQRWLAEPKKKGKFLGIF